MSESSESFGVVIDILSGKFRVPSELLTPQTTLAGLDLDSLSLVEFALTLTDRTGVHIGDAEVGAETTLAEVAATIEARSSAAGIAVRR